MKSPKEMFYRAHAQFAARDRHFMEMIQHPTNPLTNDDLRKLVDKFPQRWKRYKGFIGKLVD